MLRETGSGGARDADWLHGDVHAFRHRRVRPVKCFARAAATSILFFLVSLPSVADNASDAAVVARTVQAQSTKAQAEADKAYARAKRSIEFANEAIKSAVDARAHARAAQQAAAIEADSVATAIAEATEARTDAAATQAAAGAGRCDEARAEDRQGRRSVCGGDGGLQGRLCGQG